MSHTKGELHIGGDGTIIYDKDGWAVANSTVFHGRFDGQTSAKENARRLVACWNAANGIDTDALETVGEDLFDGDTSKIIQERNALLEMLQIIAPLMKNSKINLSDWLQEKLSETENEELKA